jgi:hypothetical protein
LLRRSILSIGGVKKITTADQAIGVPGLFLG